MIKIISDLKEMEAVADRWNELARPLKTPLLRYEWFAACAETLGHRDQLRIILSCSNGSVNGIAPLLLTRNFISPRFEILGMAMMGEPAGFIFSSEDSLRELIDAIFQMRKPLVLGRLGVESAEVRMLGQLSNGKFFSTNDHSTLSLETNTSWDQFVAGMTSNDRNHLRRKQKLLEKQGKVRFEILIPEPKNLDHYLAVMMQVEAAGWKGKKRTALLFNDRLRQFIDAYARKAARLGLLRFCFLKVNDQAIAAKIAIEDSNRFWLLKIGYDEAWKNYSPGILLTHETIRYAFEQKLEGYEFLGHDEKWIHRWTHRIHPYVTIRNYPYSFMGMGSLATEALSSLLRKVTRIRK